MVTKEAIIKTKAGILTWLGITFLSSETKRLLNTKTKITASPIPIPLEAIVVNARVGQVPRTNLRVGFDDKMPSVAIFLKLIFISYYPLEVVNN